MGLLDKMFPKRALRREKLALEQEYTQSRLKRLKKIRSLDAISGGRSRFDIKSTSADIDSEVASSKTELREQIRQYELENGNISGPFKRVVKNVVGHGIRFNPEIRGDEPGAKEVRAITDDQAKTANAQIEKHIDIWNRQADKRLILPFYGANGIQGMAEHALLRDNEVLVVGRQSKRPGRLIPFCLDLLETDRLVTPPGEQGNPLVEEGVRYDGEGVPEAYYVLKYHPGNTLSAIHNDKDFEEIPAYNSDGTKKVMFLFNPMRPEQTRAFSAIASGLKDIQDADRYMEAEKMAALEDSCMFGTIKTTDIQGWQDDENKDSEESGYDRIHEFTPNEIKYLYPEEELQVHRPVRPNTQFEAFVEQIWRGPANALDIPPEIFLQKWNDMNYSNARTVLLQFYGTCRLRQKYIADELNFFVYENLMRWFVIKGIVSAISFKARYYDWIKHSYIPPGWQWIDPKKEAEGKSLEIDIGLDNLTDTMRSKGQDPQVKLEKRAQELAYIKELEKKYDIEFTPKDKTAEPVGNTNPAGDTNDD